MYRVEDIPYQLPSASRAPCRLVGLVLGFDCVNKSENGPSPGDLVTPVSVVLQASYEFHQYLLPPDGGVLIFTTVTALPLDMVTPRPNHFVLRYITGTQGSK